jgi:hypothetical protein
MYSCSGGGETAFTGSGMERSELGVKHDLVSIKRMSSIVFMYLLNISEYGTILSIIN